MRWIVRLVSVLVTLAILAVAAVWLIPAKSVADIAAKQFEARTGRALTIGGSVVPQVWPVLGVVAGDVSIANAGWSDQGPMFHADKLEIGLDAAKLISGEVRVKALIAEAPEILLERAVDGRGNWELGPVATAADAGTAGEGAAPGAGAALPPLSLELLEVTGGRVTYLDHAAGTRVALSEIALKTAVPDPAGPVDLDLSGVMNGQAFTLKAGIGAMMAFLGGQTEAVKLNLQAGAAQVAFDGRLGLVPLAAEGQLEADLADMVALSALAGMERPSLPAGLGARSVTVTGKAILTPEGSVHLRGGTIGLDENVLTVEADVTQGADRPKIAALISARRLDLSGLTGGGGGGSGGGGTGGDSGDAAGGWPDVAIDASGLSAADAQITLTTEELDLGLITLTPLQAYMELDRARAVVDISRAGAYGGTVSGQVIANAREGFSTRANLALEDMDMQALLRQFAGFDRLMARGTLRFNLLGSGTRLPDLVRSLSGEGSLVLGQGEFRGLDLAGMLINLDPSYVGPEDKTIFDKVTASFAVQGGVLQNDDLKFAAPLVTATGAGKVDMNRQWIDYRIKPVALPEADGTGGVMVPLIIKGPWNSPDLKLDVEALAKERLAEEQAKLEQKAKEELAKKAAEELGVTIDPNAEDLEKAARDALEQKLQEEAAKALQDLLGGN